MQGKLNYAIDASMNIQKIRAAVAEMQKSFNTLKLPQTLREDITNTIGALRKEIKDFEEQTEGSFESTKDVKKLSSSYNSIVSNYKQLLKYIGKIDSHALELLPDTVIDNIQKANFALKDYESSMKSISSEIAAQNRELKKQREINNKATVSRKNLIDENIKLGSTKGGLATSIKNLKDQREAQYSILESTEKGSAAYLKASNSVKELTDRIKRLEKQYDDTDRKIKSNQATIAKYSSEITQSTNSIDEITAEINKLESTYSGQALTKLRQELANIKGTNISEIPDDLEQIKSIISNLSDDALEQIENTLKNIKNNANAATPALESIGQQVKGAEVQAEKFERVNKQLESFRGHIESFFGITNTIYLFQRAIRQSYESVKELDKAMTETAVVTDFSVNDMWEALPRYTAAANELGTTTLGAYETMTLYYQQGLKTNEVFEIGTETMKMARIASMDYTKATDLMTAALRGFNMELNETSARRINDVYSELAAITAADTEEIADAMTRTASIANSAGMEFETTSAFLSQMIETTREAPENLGTAMKSIIARFQELKKAPSEIASEIDGEALDVNKVDTALKSVGISLTDTTGQFRKLDDVFLELASKWDSLDKNTQRYIATIAAGSRQQSRFIAMMSNYERTMELVDAANNSAGASQRQFEKTTESLESKLNKLTNAWNEFTRNLANSAVIKDVIDLGTNLFTIINKILNVMPSGISTIVALTVALTALSVTKKGLDAVGEVLGMIATGKGLGGSTFIESFKQILNSQSQQKKGFLSALIRGFTSTSAAANVAGEAIGKTGKVSAGAIGETHGLAKAVSLLKNPYVLATVAVVGLGVALYNIAKGQTPEAKIKKLNEAASEASSQSEELKSSLISLNTELEHIEELNKSFDGLIRGTNEWNEKLLESNALVADLINQYPQLAKYMTVNDDGYIAVEQVGIEELKTILEEQQKTANNISSLINSRLNILDAEEAKNNLDISSFNNGKIVTKDVIAKLADIIGANPQLLKYDDYDLQKELANNNIAASQELITEIKNAGGELIKAYNNGQQAELAQDKILESTIKGSLSEQINMNENIISAVSQISSDNYNALVEEKKNELKSWTKGIGQDVDKDEIREWASRMGYEFISQDTFDWDADVKNLATGEIEHISDEIIASQLAEIRAYDEIVKSAQNLANSLEIVSARADEVFQGIGIDETDIIPRLLSGDSTLDKNLIAGLNNSNDLNKLIEATFSSLDEPSQKELIANILGKSIDEITLSAENYYKDVAKILKESAKNIEEVQLNRYKNVGNILAKGFSKDLKQAEKQIPKISQLINNLSENQLSFIENLGQTINDNLGKSGLKDFTTELEKLYSEGNASIEEQEEFEAFFANLDFSNPIAANQKLNVGLKNSNKYIKDFSNSLLNTGESLLNISEQFKFFYTSQEYTENLSEDIQKLVKENGKITSNNIIELTKSSGSLASLLDEGTLSANSLAKALTLLENGTLTINDLSVSVLKAIDSMNGLENATESAFNTIDNWQPARSLGDIGDWVNELADDAVEQFQGGEYGNDALISVIQKLFGVDSWEAALNAADGNLEKAEKQFIDKLNNLQNNLYGAWREVALNYQNKIAEFNKQHETNLGIALSGGAIKVDTAGMSTEEFTNALADIYEVSQEYAEMLISDFKRYSSDFAQVMARNDLEHTLEQFYHDSIIDINGKSKTIYNAKDIQNIAVTAGIDKDQFLKDLAGIESESKKTAKDIKAEFKKNNIGFLELYDESGILKGTTELKKELIEALNIKDDIELKNLFIDDESGAFIIDNFQKMMNQLGVPEEAINNILTDFATNFEDTRFELGGVEIPTDDIKNNVGEALTETAELSQWNTIGETIANTIIEAFNKINIQVVKSANGYKISFINATTQIQNSMNSLTPPELHGKLVIHPEIGGIETNSYNGNYVRYRQQVKPQLGTGKEFTDKSTETTTKTPEEQAEEAAKKYINSVISGLTSATAYDNKNSQSYGPEKNGSGGDKDQRDPTEVKKFADALDKLYNVFQRLEKELRMVNKYQERYNRLVESLNVKGVDLQKNLQKQSTEYNRIIKNTDRIKTSRENSINNILNSKAKFTYTYKKDSKDGKHIKGDEVTKFTKANISKWFSYANGIVTVKNISAYNKLRKSSPELYEHLEEIRKKLEGFQSDVEDAEDKRQEAIDALEDMKKIGKEQFLDLENRVYSAIVGREQDKIDKLSQINDSINDANSQLIDAVQDNISKIRQDRENQETEDDIAAKERRLAYLRRDTSNANALEIKQLEEELADQKQDYTDTLIDQKISALQEQNDVAADQRQQQIDLLQAQLDYDQENGYFWSEAHQLMREGIDQITGEVIAGSKMVGLLQSQEGWAAFSETAKGDWMQELNSTVAQMWLWLKGNKNSALGGDEGGQNTLTNAFNQRRIKTGDQITATDASGKKFTGTVSAAGNLINNAKPGDNVYFKTSGDDLYQDADGNWHSNTTFDERRRFTEGTEWNLRVWNPNSKKINIVKAIANHDGLLTYKGTIYDDLRIDKNGYYYTKKAAEEAKKQGIKFKTGGLADFTGPAWLDGTKSKPEIVLNQRDTENFIQLKDILRSLLNNKGNYNSGNSGDNFYEIHIEVDKLESDYDVEQVAEKVKRIINSDARYRNVNAINRLR